MLKNFFSNFQDLFPKKNIRVFSQKDTSFLLLAIIRLLRIKPFEKKRKPKAP